MAINCFHCLEAVPSGFNQTVLIDGTQKNVCCIGCQAVAETIIAQGMTDYYKYRTVQAGKVEQLVPEQLKLVESYDNPDIQDEFISQNNDISEVLLTIEGITCAACAWLIETQLLKLSSIKRVDVNTSTNRAMIQWDKTNTPLSAIIKSLLEIGYKAYPFQADIEANQKQQVAKAYIRRLGVAGLMTMQVMMFAFAMYFGMFSGMEDNFEQYFRWISLILASPVVLYSALPFLTNAINGLKAKQLNMDLPVSLAIFGAFGASSYATIMQVGEVYFESICMFTFLLLLGKYLEFRARLKASEFTANLQKLLPLTARTIDKNNNEKIIAAKKLKLHDRVLIKAGETIPADGIIITGTTSVDESMMTGEHCAVNKYPEHAVFAGTVNHDGVIEIEINKIGQNTLLNQIIKLQHNALATRPKLVEVTDKIAQWFVACLLIFASITAIGWYQVDPEHAFWVTIAVLVATCPCALSLAIPTALTCAVASLTRRGILIKQPHVLETLPQLTDFAFDKTGTLTQGRFSLDTIDIIDSSYNKEQLLSIVAQLESYSEHPIATAFSAYTPSTRTLKNIKIEPGKGVTGHDEKNEYAIGKSGWFDTQKTNAQATFYINKVAVAHFYFIDPIKDNAQTLINNLHVQNFKCHLLTGDSSNAGQKVAEQLNLDSIQVGCSARDKQLAVEKWSADNKIIAMIGDGVNDTPVFNSAHLSIAMETGADISKNTADVVLLNSDLAAIGHLLVVAKQTRRIVKQNLALSLVYNGTILPLAALGMVAPWMAVIGMSASSIIVISNSLRLLKL